MWASRSVTLFDDRGGLDAAGTAALAASLAGEGMRAILVSGSTGEAATLDPAERVELVTAVRAAVPAGVPVLAGTGAPSARQAARLTAAALEAGADGVLALSPPGSADLERYYRDVITAAGGAPVFGYHYPGMSAPGIDVELLPRLGELGLLGLKDSSGDASRLIRTLERFDGALVRRIAVAAVGGRATRRDRRHPRRCQRRAGAVDQGLRR